MKKFIISIIPLLLIYSFSYSQSQYKLLEKAYNKNSLPLLDSFFVNWQNEIKPISQKELDEQNDTVKAVYELFTYIYQPLDLSKISNSNYYSNSNAYSKAKYAIVQNSISYRFVDKYRFQWDSLFYKDTLPDFSKGIYEDAHLDIVFCDSLINNFRPNVRTVLKPVYLNDKYEKILVVFLVGKYPSHPYNLIEESIYSMDEITERYNFLHHMIEFPAPYYSSFSLITYPDVSVIDFTKDFLKARIRYDVDDETWLMFLKKNGSVWDYLNHKHHGWY